MHIPPAAPGARGKVWFVGAGPGDPELITLKGQRLLAQAGAVLFAGSLVNEAVTRFAPAGCEVRDSSRMTLQEMTDGLTRQARRHATVVRLQTGDPALYGALIELARPLAAAGVDWAVVPGVSSAMAGCMAEGNTTNSMASAGHMDVRRLVCPIVPFPSEANGLDAVSLARLTPQSNGTGGQPYFRCVA